MTTGINTFDSRTYCQLRDQFVPVCDWLESLNINISPTRIGKYKRQVTKLAEATDTEALAKLKQEFPDEVFINLGYETSNWMHIHKGLRQSKTSSELTSLLIKAISAPEMLIDDKKGQSGRDFAYELYAAAYLRAGDYKFDWTTTADIRAQHDQIKLLAECKRPRSEATLVRNLRDSFGQLRERYTLDRSAFGVTFIALDLFVTNELRDIGATNLQEAADKVKIRMEMIVRSSFSLWQDKTRDKRTLGVIFTCNCPTTIGEQRLVTNIHWVHAVPLGPARNFYFEENDQFHKILTIVNAANSLNSKIQHGKRWPSGLRNAQM